MRGTEHAPLLSIYGSKGAQMARYYFDLVDSDGLVVDDEGREIEGLQNVQIEAARSLIDMARDSLMGTAPFAVEQLSIQVRDESGRVLNAHFSFDFERTN